VPGWLKTFFDLEARATYNLLHLILQSVELTVSIHLNCRGIIMPSVQVKGMSCRHCVASVTESLEKIDGISNVQVDLSSGTVTYDGDDVSMETIKTAVASIGFEVVE
jgi:copper ion binding protein